MKPKKGVGGFTILVALFMLLGSVGVLMLARSTAEFMALDWYMIALVSWQVLWGLLGITSGVLLIRGLILGRTLAFVFWGLLIAKELSTVVFSLIEYGWQLDIFNGMGIIGALVKSVVGLLVLSFLGERSDSTTDNDTLIPKDAPETGSWT